MQGVLTIKLCFIGSPLLREAQRLLAARIRERGGPVVGMASTGTGHADIVLGLQPGIGTEGFRIDGPAEGPVRITGNDERGLLYGVGKFLRTCRYARGFECSAWRGTSVPAKPVRGMYFATHFHNFYHDAPVPEVERYVEDLALWGYNALAVWFDMHHYRGIDDPDAVEMLERLRAVLRAARRVGMSSALTTLANEGYSTTPAELRATPTGRAHYGVEICASTEPGEALILKNHRERLEAFADVGVDMLWLWPYDQGGCSCSKCKPWGSNGMLRVGEKVARMCLYMFPRAHVLYSTWLFDFGSDQGEWAGLAKAFAERPDWVHAIMADSHTRFPEFPLRHGVPGNLPLLNFPEISMWGMTPWGGFGANPLCRRFQELWQSVKDLASGGFPYSEGIFEDLNKVLYAQFYWSGGIEIDEALREYFQYEFGSEACGDLLKVLDVLERNHAPQWFMYFEPKEWGVGSPAARMKVPGYPKAWRVAQDPVDAVVAAQADRICGQVEAAMPDWARSGWRWRILRLRVLIDHLLASNGGDWTAACDPAFQELVTIYHAQKAEPAVEPPALKQRT